MSLLDTNYEQNETQAILDLPDFTDLKRTLDAYYEIDRDALELVIEEKYETTSGKIMMLPLRFFKTFINEQASLFSNTFVRDASGDFNEAELNQALMECERYFFMFKKSALYFSITEDSELVDDNEIIHYKALDPTIYFRDARTGYYWLKTDFHEVVMYIPNEDKSYTKYKYIGEDGLTIFDDVDFGEVLGNFDYKKDLTQQYYTMVEDIDYLPILELSDNRVLVASGNGLVDIQENYIKSASWGLFNADPKLLTQVAITTDMSNEEAKANFANLGHTTKIIKLGLTDQASVFDTGDIKVLVDLMKQYSAILEQEALVNGVDKNAIVNNNKMVSGESKKVELNYINKFRRNYFIIFANFEKLLFKNIEKLISGISYNGIKFLDIDLAPDPMQKVLLASEMQLKQYFNFIEAFAYVRSLTVEEAIEEIKIRKIKLDESGNLEQPLDQLGLQGVNYAENQQPSEPQPTNNDTRPRTGK